LKQNDAEPKSQRDLRENPSSPVVSTLSVRYREAAMSLKGYAMPKAEGQ
jgi:hypothetical protein